MKGSVFRRGTVEGTGSAINISLGFTPAAVQVINIDGDAMMWWTDDMTDGEAYKIVAAGTNAQIGTGGVTPYAGSPTPGSEAAVGFTIGADTDVNASAETIMWMAWGTEDATT